MQQQHERNGDIEQFLQHLNGQESAEQGADEDIQETIHVYFVREQAAPQKDEQGIESTPPKSPQRKSDLPAYTTILFFIFLILSCLAFQLYLVFNPPIVIVTVVPRSQTVHLTGTLQLGRVLVPITLSQSQTVPTTGKGHQDPKQATGFITFYNGLLSEQTVPAGTLLTGSDGVEITTNQDANIPSAAPPIEGQATITAHAINSGSQGNISAKDINEACCAVSILAVNFTPFHGGQDERDFQTVAKSDIVTVATPLKTAVQQDMQKALQGELKPNEQLQTLPCHPTVASDHQIGEEARLVTVTVSVACSAIAYDTKALEIKATQLLTTQAVRKLGTGYTLLGSVQVSVIQATAQPRPTLVLSYQGIWVYAISNREQQRIKSLITGKSYQQAMQVLKALPGVERVSIQFDENTKLPKDSRYIHLELIAGI